MSGMQALFMNYGPQLLIVDSADFDGTDYMTTGAGLSGASDSKSGIISFWMRIDGGDGTFMFVFQGATTVGGTTSRFRIRNDSSNKYELIGINAAGTTILDIETTTAYTAGATWRHFLASWNLATGTAYLYVNDVSDLTSTTLTDDSIDYTVADWAVGANAGGLADFDGCIAELYFAPGQFLNFSIVSNRRKFISSSGKPVYLGADGSGPTGTAAICYQHLADAEAVANFATNRGTGGDFSITGTLATGSTSPSD